MSLSLVGGRRGRATGTVSAGRTAVVAALLAVALSGCDSYRPKATDSDLSPSELRAVERSPERTLPLVDIHAHTFNGRCLPLVGIALGKRDKTWFTQLFPDPVVIRAARYLSEVTVWQPITRERAKEGVPAPDAQGLRAARAKEGNASEEDPAMRAIRKVVEDSRSQAVRGEFRKPDPTLSPEERAALRRLGILGEIDFVAALVRDDRLRVPAYRAAFGLEQRDALIVSHMMDLGPVYGQEASEGELVGFKEQIERMDALQSQSNGAMLYFVAYCPFRKPTDPGSAGMTSLDLVKVAIREHHAYGVKVYPPSGYRPIRNSIPSRAWAFSREPGRQWDYRYEGRTDSSLDNELRELLVWCEQEDVPVFVHCNYGEFEARSGYGELMADPVWWKAYLASRSAPGKPCTLRLCLGHAGGPDFWFGVGDHDGWGRTVLELCTTYPNVYCEMGVHTEILRQRAMAAFVGRLSRLFEQEPAPDRPYRLADKLMYGTDWFMPGPVSKPKEYLDAYELAFLSDGLRSCHNRFFLGNALCFLNASGVNGREGVDPRAAEMLQRLQGLWSSSDAGRNGPALP